jgi:hypothetical protein
MVACVVVDRACRGREDRGREETAEDHQDQGHDTDLGQGLPDPAAAEGLRRGRLRSRPYRDPVKLVEGVGVAAGQAVAVPGGRHRREVVLAVVRGAGLGSGGIRHVVVSAWGGASGPHRGWCSFSQVMRLASSVRPGRGLGGNRTRSRIAISPFLHSRISAQSVGASRQGPHAAPQWPLVTDRLRQGVAGRYSS